MLTPVSRHTMTIPPLFQETRLMAQHEMGKPSLEAYDYADSSEYLCQAVERVIVEMNSRIATPLSLQDMAEIAALSPSYFHRVFRDITGIPPYRFQVALRLEMAKGLLLTTQLSVTDVCQEIGYDSLGTFTTHFTRHVGISPRGLRRLMEHQMPCIHTLTRRVAQTVPFHCDGITVRVAPHFEIPELIFVGLFDSPIPQKKPVYCTVLTHPGKCYFASIPDGKYYVCAAAFAWSDNPLNYLLPNASKLLVGAGDQPLELVNGHVVNTVDVSLRRKRLTDPPLLLALPAIVNVPTVAQS